MIKLSKHIRNIRIQILSNEANVITMAVTRNVSLPQRCKKVCDLEKGTDAWHSSLPTFKVEGLFLLRLIESAMFGATFNLVRRVGLP